MNYFITHKEDLKKEKNYFKKFNFLKIQNEKKLHKIFESSVRFDKLANFIIQDDLKWNTKNGVDILFNILQNKNRPNIIYIFGENIIEKLLNFDNFNIKYEDLIITLNDCSIFYKNTQTINSKMLLNELVTFKPLKSFLLEKLKNIIIINNNIKNTANELKNNFKIDNLITFNKIFKTILNKNNNVAINYIIIYIHLSWEGNDLDKNYGLEIAYNLRVMNYACPIILVSPLSISKLLSLNIQVTNLYNKILLAPKSYFFKQNKDTFTQYLKNIDLSPISNNCLIDIQQNLLNKEGYIIEKIKHALFYKSNLNKRKIENIFTEIQFLLPTIPLQFYKENLLLNVENKEKYNEIIEELAIKIKNNLSNKNNLIKSNNKKIKPLVLIVEDEINEIFLQSFIKIMKENFNIHLVQSALKAKQIIDHDESFKIKAIIVDWRLYNYNNHIVKWQNFQGYDLLEYAYMKGYRTLITLTAQSNDIVYKIRNEQFISYKIYKKENLPNQIDFFIQQLFNDIELNTNLNLQMPDGNFWLFLDKSGNSFSTIYKNLLNSNKVEKINIAVENFIHDKIQYMNNKIMLACVQLEKLDTNSLHLSKLLPNLPSPKKRIFTNQDLINLLINRRCFLYIYFYIYTHFPTFSNDIIDKKTYLILYDDLANSKKNLSKLIYNKKHLLCFKSDILNAPILFEETIWLKSKKWGI